MKILHTSDWHFGINLEKHSRLEEQAIFLDELIEIIEKNNIDLVLITGDIYDTFNPPAAAEKLFHTAIRRIFDGGKRAVAMIAGNHDSPDRLAASIPLAEEFGALIFPLPKTSISSGEYGGFKVTSLSECCIEVEIKNERAVIAALPYSSEKRLGELLSQEAEESSIQQSFSLRVAEIFKHQSSFFRDDTVNIAMAHFHVFGGVSSTERDLNLGGSYAVNKDSLPQNADYIALGHLHRPQTLKGTACPACYSGSPLQYSISEVGYPKCVIIADITAGNKAVISKEYLNCIKPIEVWKCESAAEALEKCRTENGRNCWAYIAIHENRPLYQNEIKELYAIKPDIAGIDFMCNTDSEKFGETALFAEKSILDDFMDFYQTEKQMPPPQEILELFKEILFNSEASDDYDSSSLDTESSSVSSADMEVLK